MAIPKAENMWVDGRLVPWDTAQVPLLTHTMHYGVGVFEGIRAYETARGPAVFRLREHMRRLEESAHIVLMQLPYTADQLCAATVELIRANGQKRCYLRPVAWYGDEAMGLGAVNTVHVGIAAFEWGAYLGEEALRSGIRAKISSFQRRSANAIPTKGKITGAYVNSVLAKREAKLGGYDEAIMLDENGFVSEATGENVFIVKDGELWTPKLGGAILAGITRDAVLRIARDMGLSVHERDFTRELLYCADECFLTGTAAEVTPVREVDDRRVGEGRMGPVTRELQATFFRAARGQEPRYASWLTYA